MGTCPLGCSAKCFVFFPRGPSSHLLRNRGGECPTLWHRLSSGKRGLGGVRCVWPYNVVIEFIHPRRNTSAFWKIPVTQDWGLTVGVLLLSPRSRIQDSLFQTACSVAGLLFPSEAREEPQGTLLHSCAIYSRRPENWTWTLHFGKVVDPDLEDFATSHLRGGGILLLKTSFFIDGSLGEFLGTCLILLLILEQLIKKMLPHRFSLAKLYVVCDLECLFPSSGGIFVSTESFCNVHSYAKPLICSLSRPLTIVLLSAFVLMYHAFIARIVHFLKIYDYLFCFFMFPERLIIAVLGTLTYSALSSVLFLFLQLFFFSFSKLYGT